MKSPAFNTIHFPSPLWAKWPGFAGFSQGEVVEINRRTVHGRAISAVISRLEARDDSRIEEGLEVSEPFLPTKAPVVSGN